ncbi:alpha/beta hydrolase [Pseudoalteromonas sp. MMG007]|uniref:alpha/beta hydrolase n=1 Tax=Pseudoalteromonas sp. MMG007 TaxID=2822684 RepID=UPI001B36FC61|nr:alpha/beta hydrolase [Pseudoalteromonas sp. MMG007]MBQ4857886.1 alpha/beta hydrolase [Pseudoalteromonas sp. MMG007]
MKQIYFNQNKPPRFAKVTKAATFGLTKTFPNLSARLAMKVFCNPHSRRKYDFRTDIQPINIKLNTQLGAINLYYFSQEGNSKAVFLSHGWADSTNRFTTLINELVEKGFNVYSIDHIGHGYSYGKVSHLYGYMQGLTAAFNYFDEQNILIDRVITHSMAGVALLNLDSRFLEDKKIVMISAPAQIFEAMFEKVKQVGISELMLENMLNKVSEQYGINWQNLHPDNSKHKINEDMLFIHDKNDSVANFEAIKHLTDNTPATLIATEKLGHVRILKSQYVYDQITTFMS